MDNISQSLYLSVLFSSILVPLIRSFEPKIYFIGNLFRVLISVFVVLLIYIPWDIWFTDTAVWGFNSEYITNIKYFQLPLEEILFFVIIPFCCLFIYEVMEYFGVNRRFFLGNLRIFYFIMACGLFLLAVINFDLKYTFWVSIITGLIIIFSALILKNLLSNFILLYIASLVPFVIVNSILTGYFTSEPIVWYSESEIMNIRFGTIPLEDFIYNFGMLLSAFVTYHLMKKR